MTTTPTAAAPGPSLGLPTLEDHEALIQFIYMAPIGLAQTRADGEIVMINPLCGQLLMPLAPDGELSNLYTVLQHLAPDLQHRAKSFEGSHGSICDAMQLPVLGLQRDRSGTPQQPPQVLSLSLLKLDEDRFMLMLGDITQAVERDRQLRRSTAWVNSIAHGLIDYALVSLDHRGRIDEWNPSIGRITGYDAAASLGQSPQLFYPLEAMTPVRMLDRLHEADRHGWSLDEGWRLRADGSRFWGSCLISPLLAPDAAAVASVGDSVPPSAGAAEPAARGYSLILQDISDGRESNEALRRSICCDHLTGLANRRAFYDAAEIEMQRWQRMPRPLSLLMIDADHFKAINDCHGHDVGDAVLRALAAGLAADFRGIDLVARIGGEEFVALLPGTTLDGAQSLALRVAESLAQIRVHVAGGVSVQAVGCTVSIGVATMEAGVDGVSGLLKRADQALYAAKSLGRNRVECWSAAAAPAGRVAAEV